MTAQKLKDFEDLKVEDDSYASLKDQHVTLRQWWESESSSATLETLKEKNGEAERVYKLVCLMMEKHKPSEDVPNIDPNILNEYMKQAQG
jgi:hypothetical protein